MTGFADLLLIRYSDPANVESLLIPQGDTDRKRIQDLLASVYEPQRLEVKTVDSVTVTAKHFQVPVVEPVTLRAEWEKVLPQPEQARACVKVPAIVPTRWIDMALETVVTAHVALTEGALDSVAFDDVSALTEQEFVARFQFLDLPALMQAAHVPSYAELQADFPRLYHLHFAEPPPFDPQAPVRTFRLRVSVLFFPTLDLGAALRQLTESKRALDAFQPGLDAYEGGDLLTTSAWLGVFPADLFPSATPPVTQQQVADVLAEEGFVAAFENSGGS
ncbi:hypothetical protein A6P39_040250 [Streptomyces sp. FXJ1.172]|uniref:hypothetical protein n=1 Tax=Streptomyces sp. FXJ1.172 TaxID=710705 RepID=UPI0007CFF214|nr:hypothetical protein [Streptomyces sp. FXJ1.172]WEO99780.1 hypothetical protein A6P39_040250 [Streptomyces sp. FXJ1.172]